MFNILLQWVKCVIFDGLLEHSSIHTIVPTQNVTGYNSSVLFCWVFHYVHFLILVNWKSDFCTSFILPNQSKCITVSLFCNLLAWSDEWNALFSNGNSNNRAIVPTSQNQILKDSTVPSLLIERFIMFIFCILVNCKHDFLTSFFLPN